MTERESMKIDLTGRRVLVTGGSRGIAAEIVRMCARSGASVAVNHSAAADQRAGHPDAASDLVAELRAEGAEVEAIEADLLDPNGPAELVERALDRFGTIDIAVLSAALQINKRFLEQTQSDVELQLRLNITANIRILQGLIPAMRASGWGRIVTIGSVQEVAPSAQMPVYAMTKAALENLVRNLAVENAPYGITVNNVAPGLVQTDRNARLRNDMAVWREFSANANPLGRAGLPGDIAGVVVFLASDAAAFITGATIYATGGSHIPLGRVPANRPDPEPAVPLAAT